jgi:hypothetical protein
MTTEQIFVTREKFFKNLGDVQYGVNELWTIVIELSKRIDEMNHATKKEEGIYLLRVKDEDGLWYNYRSHNFDDLILYVKEILDDGKKAKFEIEKVK